MLAIFVLLSVSVLIANVDSTPNLYANGHYRKGYISTAEVMDTLEIYSLIQCVGVCNQRGCKGINFSKNNCTLLAKPLCREEMLEKNPEFTYYDVHVNPAILKKNQLEECKNVDENPEDVACYEDCVCRIIDGKNEKCIFPFIYNSENITACTEKKNPGAPWCATSLYPSGEYYYWGTCNENCPVEKV